jgi:hypothetical protein
VSVDVRGLLMPGNKNWQRAGGFPKQGEAKTIADCIKDGVTIGDIRWWIERGHAELTGQELKFVK